MNNTQKLFENNEARWTAVILRSELEQLKREEGHLRAKLNERTLTLWESTRLEKIFDDMMKLLSEFGTMAIAQEGKDKYYAG